MTYLVIWVGLISDRLGNFNGGGQEIMQSCTADNVTNNNQMAQLEIGSVVLADLTITIRWATCRSFQY